MSEQSGRELENKALGLFAHKELGDFIDPLMTSKAEEAALLQKYEDLLKLGIRLRKKLVSEMPIPERAAIWRTQLAYHLATSYLNTKQKEFIVDVMPKIQSIFEDSANLSGEEKNKYTEALEPSMFRVFTKPEAFAVFMTIGIQKNVPDNSEILEQFKVGYISQNPLRSQTARSIFTATSILSRVGESNSSKFSNALLSQAPACACRWYCEGSGNTCGDQFCHKTSTGCGPFDTSECTNRCESKMDEPAP